jgi:non-homologous end joining protein Ku
VLRQIEHVLGVDTDTYIEVSKDELENIALESNRTIDIDEFVPKSDIDPRYLIRPYYLIPDGKVGHDAFTVIRETIHSMDMVAIEPRAHHRAGAIRKRVDGDASQVPTKSGTRRNISTTSRT